MSISPLSFSLPVSQLREALDRPDGGSGGVGFPSSGTQSLPGAAERFAGALREALQAGGTDALDQISQSSLGTQFMSLMGQGEAASQAAGLSDMHLLLDAIGGGGGQGGGPDLMGLLGGAIPGGLEGLDLKRVAEAMRMGGVLPGVGGASGVQPGSAKPMEMAQRIGGPQRVSKMDYMGGAQAVGQTPRPDQIVSAAKQPVAADALAQASAGTPIGASAGAPPTVSGITRIAAPSPTLNMVKNALAQRAYGRAEAHAPKVAGPDVLGMLSARFESGGDVAAIGYDRTGGTSYGTYQISSRAGTFDMFMSFLEKNAPGIASRLQAAGPANTGSTAGPMPSAWKTVAHEEPERFGKLQHDFINESHFKPALRKIADMSGIDLGGRTQALAQVLWSTAVQHGPTGSARIFSAALDALGSMGSGPQAEGGLIREVYARRSGDFGSSSGNVQHAVRGRFNEEMKAALSMLEGTNLLDSGA